MYYRDTMTCGLTDDSCSTGLYLTSVNSSTLVRPSLGIVYKFTIYQLFLNEKVSKKLAGKYLT